MNCQKIKEIQNLFKRDPKKAFDLYVLILSNLR